MMIDTVVYFQVTDPVKYAYEHANPRGAIENLAATTLRNIVGEMDLMRRSHPRYGQRQAPGDPGRSHDKWGIKVTRSRSKHRAAQGPPGRHGEADARRARAPRGDLKAECEKRASILRLRVSASPPSTWPRARSKPPS